MKKYWLFLILVLFLGACGQEEKEPQQTPPRKIKATLLTVNPKMVPKVRVFPGTVRAVNQISLSSKISGYVKAVHVKEGDVVRPGSPIITLDDAPIRAQIKALKEAYKATTREKEAVRARLSYAEANYRRFKNLLAEKAATKEEFDRVTAEYKALLAREKALAAKEKEILARLKEVKSILPYTQIKSPTEGLVAKRLADKGSFVNAGTPLVFIDDLSGGFEFRVELDEAFLGKLRPGQRFKIMFPAVDLVEEAPVKEIVAHIDPQSRTFLVKLALPKNGVFRSGLYGELYFPVSHKKAVLIPWRAVVLRGELTGVMVVEKDGLARFRVVRLGRSYQKEESGAFFPTTTPLTREKAKAEGLWAEVLAGLEAGEKIVISPLNLVRDGDRVI